MEEMLANMNHGKYIPYKQKKWLTGFPAWSWGRSDECKILRYLGDREITPFE